jgi:hypothetical protein
MSSSNLVMAIVNALQVMQTKGLISAIIYVSTFYDAHNNDEVKFDGPNSSTNI